MLRQPSRLIPDAAANDSDKSFTVPDNLMWQLAHAYVSNVASATAGNRQLTLEIWQPNAAGAVSVLVGAFPAPAVQAESTTETYHWVGGLGLTSEVVAGVFYIGVPDHLLIPPSYIVRIRDSAAIDAAADDMTVYLWVNELPSGTV